MTDLVAGLVKRRAELASKADTLRSQLAQIGTDLGHLDAVIRQFDPEHDVAGIRRSASVVPTMRNRER